MSKLRWWIAALAATSLVVTAGCGDDDDDDEAAPETTVEERDQGDEPVSEATIVTTDYDFEAPSELRAGVVTVELRNDGEHAHEAAMIKVPDDYDEEQFAEDFAGVQEGGPLPAAFEAVTGTPEIEGGESATVRFLAEEGRYFLVCTLTDESQEGEGGEEGDPEGAAEGQEGESTGEEDEAAEQEAEPHYELGMIQEITVTGDGDAELPAAAGSFTARDYSFEVDVSAGRGTYNFINEGPDQFHHVVVFGFPEGVDEAAAREAFDAFAQAEQSGEPPPAGTPEPEETGFSGVYSPGLGGTFEAEFESGRTYGAVCFIQDKEGGPPHAFGEDMVEFFTVE